MRENILKLLADMDKLSSENYHCSKTYYPSKDEKSPVEVWKAIVSRNEYDFMLDDESILCFYPETGSLLYIECPYYSFKEWCAKHMPNEEPEIAYWCYIQFRDQENKDSTVYLRYDYADNKKGYDPYYHPSAHLHFKLDGFRIGIKAKLDEYSFTCLVLKIVIDYKEREKLDILRSAKDRLVFSPKSNPNFCPEDARGFYISYK